MSVMQQERTFNVLDKAAQDEGSGAGLILTLWTMTDSLN